MVSMPVESLIGSFNRKSLGRVRFTVTRAPLKLAVMMPAPVSNVNELFTPVFF